MILSAELGERMFVLPTVGGAARKGGGGGPSPGTRRKNTQDGILNDGPSPRVARSTVAAVGRRDLARDERVSLLRAIRANGG